MADTASPTQRSISLLIPGLLGISAGFDGVEGPFPSTGALQTYLSRADCIPTPAAGFEEQVLALFGISARSDADAPIAAITRTLDMGVIDNGWWLRADPVHLRPMHGRLVLLDRQMAALTQEEATRLAAELTAAYAEAGWSLKAPRPDRWYLKPPRAPQMVTTPLPQVVGKDIHPYLPRGKDGKAWQTVLNEMQILLHTAAVNAEREQRGDLPINSLWFWGGGQLPNIKTVAWTDVYSEESLSLALARLSQTPAAASPSNFSEWETKSRRAGASLIVLDRARAAVQYRDVAAWTHFVEGVERDWIEPCLRAVKSGVVTEVALYTGDSRCFRVGRSQMRRWWRRRRPLAAYG